MVIFSPWAFGTTEPWSIWTMNISAYALGILLVTKWITRLATKYNPNPEPDKNELSPKQNRLRLIQKTCTIFLAGSMFLLVSYILTSAINAQASFNFDTNEYTYFEGVNNNFPHSYDARGNLVSLLAIPRTHNTISGQPAIGLQEQKLTKIPQYPSTPD